MTREEINAVLDRVRGWPPERQERAAAVLMALEEGEGTYLLSGDELAAIEEAEAQAERGELAPPEAIKALLDRYRSP